MQPHDSQDPAISTLTEAAEFGLKAMVAAALTAEGEGAHLATATKIERGQAFVEIAVTLTGKTVRVDAFVCSHSERGALFSASREGPLPATIGPHENASICALEIGLWGLATAALRHAPKAQALEALDQVERGQYSIECEALINRRGVSFEGELVGEGQRRHLFSVNKMRPRATLH